MSDDELRAVERQLAGEPHQVELRLRHAQLLARTGAADAALAALDLAWRLGADEAWDELQAGLARRRARTSEGLELAWIPPGPFAMGLAGFDADCAPVHLVELSGFFVTATCLRWLDFRDTPAYPTWLRDQQPSPWAEQFRRGPALFWEGHAQVSRAVAALPLPPGLRGRWALPTEAQWERVFRASHLRADGKSPYGAELDRDRPEWTADRYDPGYYARSPKKDPPGPAAREANEHVVRGVPGLTAPYRAIYREAVAPDGSFAIDERRARHEQGIAARAVFLPGAP